MCGINLIVSATATDLQIKLGQMMQKTAFRGPDAEGEFIHNWGRGQLALGANRLRITDADANADQPIVSDCGNYMLAYNGQAYNFHDLKSDLLRSGQQFKTSSDTEVVLYWLKQKGTQGLGQLKGMFALVFVDLLNEKIILGRDDHGIKPLFFHAEEGNLVVSSALEGIHSSGLVKRSLNKDAIGEYLSYRHVLGNHTFYQDVMALAPGSFIEFHKGSVRSGSFVGTSEDKNPSNLREALTDALSLTTHTHQPAGLFLSGGVDSTLLLAIYRHELGYHKMPTYTLNTGEDARWSIKAAKQYDADHTLVDVSLEDLSQAVEFLGYLDQPIADHGALATWLISEKASVNHRVMLSGAGADELFGGYNRHLAFDRFLKSKNSWLLLKQLADNLGYFAYPKRLKTFLQAIDSSNGQTFENFLKIHGINYKFQNTSSSSPTGLPVDKLSEALEFDQGNYLVNDVLAITDLATMSHAIETRVPYLYDDVVAATGQIPVEERIRQKGKAPLRQLLKDYGGKAFVSREKMGFGLPMADFMRSNQFPLWSVLQPDDPVYEFVRREAITMMKTEHQGGRKDWNMQLWSILVLSNWLKKL